MIPLNVYDNDDNVSGDDDDDDYDDDDDDNVYGYFWYLWSKDAAWLQRLSSGFEPISSFFRQVIRPIPVFWHFHLWAQRQNIPMYPDDDDVFQKKCYHQ